MYPNLFVIGAAKSGTSALHYYLSLHPEVHMSREKEPHYFSRAMAGEKRLSRRAYERLFDSDLPIRGESSVSYSFWPYPQGVPEEIHAVAPAARFIYLVRDPVERSIIHYFHRVGLGTETRTLREVVSDPRDHDERYLAASSYATQAEQYLKLFPADRLLILDHSELRHDRHRALRKIFGFLDVDPSFTSPKFDVIVNPSSEHVRFTPLGQGIADSSVYKRMTGWIRPDVRRRLISPVRRRVSQTVEEPAVDDEIVGYFKERLSGEAKRLRDLTGEPFASWSV
jgi:hypothetical protein